MDELLSPTTVSNAQVSLKIASVSIMGKAGILPGNKGDIMLATAHVMEVTPHNYIVDNDLSASDFDDLVKVFSGPMLTVLGTSLQPREGGLTSRSKLGSTSARAQPARAPAG